jgi:hypothetical protein
MSEPKQKALFQRSLSQGGGFRLNQITGELWPKDVYSRSYRLRVVAVTFEHVTFELLSVDYDPRHTAQHNPMDHGTATVPYRDDPKEMLVEAARQADPEFYKKYTPISPHEARRRHLEHGYQFSEPE